MRLLQKNTECNILKCNPTAITSYNIEVKLEASPSVCVDSPKHPRDTLDKVTLSLGRCSRRMRKTNSTNKVYL
jgi:hypothetical protein